MDVPLAARSVATGLAGVSSDNCADPFSSLLAALNPTEESGVLLSAEEQEGIAQTSLNQAKVEDPASKKLFASFLGVITAPGVQSGPTNQDQPVSSLPEGTGDGVSGATAGTKDAMGQMSSPFAGSSDDGSAIPDQTEPSGEGTVESPARTIRNVESATEPDDVPASSLGSNPQDLELEPANPEEEKTPYQTSVGELDDKPPVKSGRHAEAEGETGSSAHSETRRKMRRGELYFATPIGQADDLQRENIPAPSMSNTPSGEIQPGRPNDTGQAPPASSGPGRDPATLSSQLGQQTTAEGTATPENFRHLAFAARFTPPTPSLHGESAAPSLPENSRGATLLDRASGKEAPPASAQSLENATEDLNVVRGSRPDFSPAAVQRTGVPGEPVQQGTSALETAEVQDQESARVDDGSASRSETELQRESQDGTPKWNEHAERPIRESGAQPEGSSTLKTEAAVRQTSLATPATPENHGRHSSSRSSSASDAKGTAPSESSLPDHPLHEQSASPRPGPMRELKLQVEGANAERVQLNLRERNGDVVVSVRSRDESVASVLRADLGDLVRRFTAEGIHAEVRSPQYGRTEKSASAEDSAGSRQEGGDQGASDGKQQGSGQRHRDVYELWEEIGLA